MATVGIKFLYAFSLGEYNVNNPGINVISVTSTATGDHDKVNLTTTPLRETWRSSDLSAQYIVIQTNDTSLTPDVFAILNHNFSSDAVVLLQANNSDSWGAPAFETAMVWNKKHLVALVNLNDSYAYYRFKILDPGNPCGYVEIGRIIGGLSFTMTQNEDIADDVGVKTDDLAYKMNTEGFFRAFNERVKVQTLSLQFPKISTITGSRDNYDGLLEMSDFVGVTLPFLTILDPDDPYFKLIWGNFTKIPSESYTVNRYASIAAEIEEVY